MAELVSDNWVERLQSTDDVRDQALTELRDILLRGLSAACRNRYGNKVQPEDVVQDALMKIIEKLDTFEGRSKFTTWAMTIAVRIAMSEMRLKRFKDVSMDQLLTDSMRFEPVASPVPESDFEVEKSRMLSMLGELIETKLSQKQRDAMHAFLNGMPVEVFAKKTGSNRNAVYKLVHDARVKLRRGFEEAGYQVEEFNSFFA